MMKILQFFKLPKNEMLLFLLNVLLCGLAKFAILVFPYKKLSPYFGTYHPMMSASTLLTIEQQHQALRIRRLVQLAARHTPWDSSCLTQAMVAKFWCQRHQVPYFMFIGLPKTIPDASNYEAHAWLTAGPIPITGGQGWLTHQVLLTYSNLSLFI